MRRLLKKTRKRAVRYGLVTANIVVLLAVVTLVIHNSTYGASLPHNNLAVAADNNSVASHPLDQVSSADIAVNLAHMTALPETDAVTNYADSFKLESTISAANDQVVAKPQVLTTAVKTRKDIQTYQTVAGDTVSSVASKLGVTSDSIRWSNSLTGDTLPADKQLVVPPAGINGIVYTVRQGDTAESLAKKYTANQDQLININDIEVSGLKPGMQIIIPDGTIPTAPVTARYATATTTYSSYGSGFAFGTSPIYGGNGYAYGWCTYYAAARSGAPSNWGNANTWDRGARASGWTVSGTPIVGAIGQTYNGFAGHVGIVEAVSPDGSQIKYSDMNGIAGWGRVGYSDWVPTYSVFQRFIYR
jgi:surface antigen